MQTPTLWTKSSLAIRLSAMLHAVSVLSAILWPEHWLWFGAVVITNHVILFIAVFFPRSAMLGQNVARLPTSACLRREIALTFDDGPDPEITPRILEILAQHNARASFFCVASRAALYPDLVREIIRRGHSVENHSRYHANYFAFLGWRACKQEVQAAQQILTAITASAPKFFRAPMGFRSPILELVLSDLNLTYTSWTRRGFDTTSRNPVRILERLLDKLHAGDILLLHDGICWPKNKSPHMTLQVLPELLQQLQAAGYRTVSLPMAFATEKNEEVASSSVITTEMEFGRQT